MKLEICVSVIGAAGTGKATRSVEHDFDELEDFDTAMKETAQDFEGQIGCLHGMYAAAVDRYYTAFQARRVEQEKAKAKAADDAKPDVLGAQVEEGGTEVGDAGGTEPAPPLGGCLPFPAHQGENGQVVPQGLAATPTPRMAGATP